MQLIHPSTEILAYPENLSLLERAGRVCYQTEPTDNDPSAFIRRIVNNGHLSVIEHLSVTVRFIVDRGVSHELVRHRLASFSQESTRYCNYTKQKFMGGITFIIPPWVDVSPGVYTGVNNPNLGENYAWIVAMLDSEMRYKNLLENGWTPEQARTVLPNSTKTELIMTANFREWLHIFNLRCTKQAHPQMREIMLPLRKQFIDNWPSIFEGRS